MIKQLFLVGILLSSSISILGQPFEKTFISKNGPYEQENILFELHFKEDSTLAYHKYRYEFSENETIKQRISSHSGTYIPKNDTIKLSGIGYPYYLIDSTANIIHDRFHYPDIPIFYSDESRHLKKGIAEGRQIGLLDSRFQDTSYYSLPIDTATGKYLLTIEYAIQHFYFLDFLINARLRKEDKFPTPVRRILHEAFDAEGRLAGFCVTGWFNMGSAPWSISIEYIENTNLIKRIAHGAYVDPPKRSYRMSYQIFSYDEHNSLKQIDYYSWEDELIAHYEIIDIE